MSTAEVGRWKECREGDKDEEEGEEDVWEEGGRSVSARYRWSGKEERGQSSSLSMSVMTSLVDLPETQRMRS